MVHRAFVCKILTYKLKHFQIPHRQPRFPPKHMVGPETLNRLQTAVALAP